MKLNNCFHGDKFHCVMQKFVVTNMCHNKMQSVQLIAELTYRISLKEPTGVISICKFVLTGVSNMASQQVTKWAIKHD
jgi:hypothetical protein